MACEWDPIKAETNVKKHGLGFHEATTVFGDPLAETFPDPDHSQDESRFVTIGLSWQGHLLIISHTDRGDRIRIISARRATPAERKYYEKSKS
ncbi:MAG: BrnT family toxin [Candidatus Edwardsbacteria bacterium]|nr:BrnT family toxin [Candidatus Edwardsbacteria bacterium]